MTPRTKKLIGMLVLLPGLIIYIGGVVTLADLLPRFWLAQLAYFMTAGIAWAIPAMPLIAWMNKDPADKASPPSDRAL